MHYAVVEFFLFQQISKAIDFAPSRTFYIYAVQARQLYSTMSQLTNLVRRLCLLLIPAHSLTSIYIIQTLRNLIRRRVHEAKTNA